MNEQILENGRRKIARDCRDKLKQIKKPNDKQSTAILRQYLPTFSLTLTKEHLAKCPANMWLNYYVMKLDKEINSGS
ncbi:hypothetical protein [Providencia heimbachae]|uniref:hypothetical protein n=1 Tax=Providencia heimbachae TaxID=333962 RepID=UPI00223FE822|nr:hypothetical protein [Providencia heimbachae]